MSGELDRTVHRTGARTDGIDFVMVGLKRPQGGVRVYATRHMPHLEWGQVERGYETLWHIDADMDNLLIIDKPDYPQALARLFEIWASQDAAKAETERLRALPASRARIEPLTAIGGPVLRSRSCPSCHSIGPARDDCADAWHGVVIT